MKDINQLKVATDKLVKELNDTIKQLEYPALEEPLDHGKIAQEMQSLNSAYSAAKELLQQPNLTPDLQNKLFDAIKPASDLSYAVKNYTPEEIMSSNPPYQVLRKNLEEMQTFLDMDVFYTDIFEKRLNTLSLQRLLQNPDIDVKAKAAVLNYKVTVDGIEPEISVKDFCYLCEAGTSYSNSKTGLLPLYQLIENDQALKSALGIENPYNDVIRVLNDSKYNIEQGKANYILYELYPVTQKQILDYAIENNIEIDKPYIIEYVSQSRDKDLGIKFLKSGVLDLSELLEHIDARDLAIALEEMGRKGEIQSVLHAKIAQGDMAIITEINQELNSNINSLTTTLNTSPVDPEEVEEKANKINDTYIKITDLLQNPNASFEIQQYMLGILDNLKEEFTAVQKKGDLSLKENLELYEGAGVTKLLGSIKELNTVFESIEKDKFNLYALESDATIELLESTLNRNNPKQDQQMKRAILQLKIIDPAVPGYVTMADKIHASGAQIQSEDYTYEMPLYKHIMDTKLYGEKSTEIAVRDAMSAMSKLKYQEKDQDKLVKQYNDCINFGIENGLELSIANYDLALLDTQKFITVCDAHYGDKKKNKGVKLSGILPVIDAAAEIMKLDTGSARATAVQKYVVKTMHDFHKMSAKDNLNATDTEKILKKDDFKQALEKGILNLDEVTKWLNEGILTEDIIALKVTIPNEKGELEEKPLYEHLILHEIKSDKQKNSGRIAAKLDKKFGAMPKESEFYLYRDFDFKVISDEIQKFPSSSYKGQTLQKVLKHYIDLDIREGRKSGSVLNELLIKRRDIMNIVKDVELLGKMFGDNEQEASEARQEYNALEVQRVPKAHTNVLKDVMLEVNVGNFKEIAPRLNEDLVWCMLKENIGVGKDEIHPLLPIQGSDVDYFVDHNHYQLLRDAKVDPKNGRVLSSKDKEGGISLLEYASQHKSHKEVFKYLVEQSNIYMKPSVISNMNVSSKNLIGLLKEGVDKARIQDILSGKIDSNKDVINTMCELLAAGKNNPKLKGEYKEIYNECQKQIETKFKLTETDKQQFGNLFDELTSNPRTVGLFTKSKEFQEAKEIGGMDKAKMLLAYFVTKDFDEASKDLSTMRHLNSGYKELTGSLIQRIYDKLVDALLCLKRGKSEKFQRLQEKCNPNNPGFAVVSKEADPELTSSVTTEVDLQSEKMGIIQGVGAGRGA